METFKPMKLYEFEFCMMCTISCNVHFNNLKFITNPPPTKKPVELDLFKEARVSPTATHLVGLFVKPVFLSPATFPENLKMSVSLAAVRERSQNSRQAGKCWWKIKSRKTVCCC